MYAPDETHVEPRPARSWRRRGSARAGLLTLLVGSGVVATAGIAFRPRVGGAALQSTPTAATALETERAMVVDAISRLVRGAHEVLAVRPRGREPFSEIVLWVGDAGRPGRLEAGELLVIAHSRTLRTVFAYDLDPETTSDADVELAPGRTGDAAFRRNWRDRPDVRRRVLATDVQDLRLQLRDGPNTGSRSPWRLVLTWASDSADEPSQSEVDLDLVVRGTSAQE
ncbi:MAG: hypothetical protein AB8G96_05870 [Phycisphaerales bacterium]